MEVERIYCLLGLFFAYSFAGWVFEVMAAAVRRKQFVNRGVGRPPVLHLWFAALAVTIGLQELRDPVDSFCSWARRLCAALWSGWPATCWNDSITEGGGTTPGERAA